MLPDPNLACDFSFSICAANVCRQNVLFFVAVAYPFALNSITVNKKSKNTTKLLREQARIETNKKLCCFESQYECEHNNVLVFDTLNVSFNFTCFTFGLNIPYVKRMIWGYVFVLRLAIDTFVLQWATFSVFKMINIPRSTLQLANLLKTNAQSKVLSACKLKLVVSLRELK